ncbi:hypothetical protein BP5796_12628 [Coleophoma crateriformis]|uniref:Uncharacterized protein n=1 Tax=Coleophoma crateriformis TaxID=565419 RepID=A0A3D8Q801_9HELO|nr:hypothetical protein BP5796_12628 [Coleophoma crateriformis]
MSKIEETSYMPVQDDSNEHLPLERQRKKRGSMFNFRQFLMLEGIHLTLILGVYALFLTAKYRTEYRTTMTKAHGLDTYFGLSEYNIIREFYGNANLTNKTAEADALFERIQNTDGIVALDTEWALQNGYAPSRLHPEDPTKSIYQIDMFHTLHCVYRIRNLLTSSLSLEQWLRNDDHTLHCLDYLREQLMCNPDLLLQGTEDYVHFNVNHGHTCRNSDMITDWAKSHHWSGHRQYLIDTVGIE